VLDCADVIQEKIVFNLIGNALKYTMKGYVTSLDIADTRFVHVQVSYGPNEAILTVKDSGVGIPCTSLLPGGDTS
jgi:signal transduction histidine kinase